MIENGDFLDLLEMRQAGASLGHLLFEKSDDFRASCKIGRGMISNAMLAGVLREAVKIGHDESAGEAPVVGNDHGVGDVGLVAQPVFYGLRGDILAAGSLQKVLF